VRALQLRRTTREIGSKKLPLQTLSNLLWAGCGVNRGKGPLGIPGRTAASASNSQEIDVYVALEEGTYLYDPFQHALKPVVAGDLRRLAIGRGQGNAGAEATVRLIYVADVDRLVHTSGYQEPGPTSTCSPPQQGWRPGSITATGRRFRRGCACAPTSVCSLDRRSDTTRRKDGDVPHEALGKRGLDHGWRDGHTCQGSRPSVVCVILSPHLRPGGGT
jgi:hypothetical protein